MKIENYLKNQSGQVALVVLLVMVVMLTLGISVAQRGVTDVRISQQEEDSARAFQAAEAGVEEALSTLAGSEGNFGEDTSYNVNVAHAGTEGFVVGQPIEAGETLVIDLVGASSGLTSAEVYFMDKDKDDCSVNPTAVEVGVREKVSGIDRVRRKGFDVKSRGNNFSLVSLGSYSFEGKTFCGKASVTLSGSDKEIRIKTLYNRSVVGVDPRPEGTSLGNQYVEVDSVGKTQGGVTRAVEVKRSNPQLPPIFDYVLFSGGGIVKGE